MTDKRAIPGGYICKDLITQVEMCHADILRDCDSMTSMNASREEIYRLIARILHRTHEANKHLVNIKNILGN